jgi:hypothetical protein
MSRRRRSRAAREHHDFDFLFGSWVEDVTVDRALTEQRAIDEDVWKWSEPGALATL